MFHDTFINDIRKLYAKNKYDGITERLHFKLLRLSTGNVYDAYLTLEYDEEKPIIKDFGGLSLVISFDKDKGGFSWIPELGCDKTIKFIERELLTIFLIFGYRLVY